MKDVGMNVKPFWTVCHKEDHPSVTSTLSLLNRLKSMVLFSSEIEQGSTYPVLMVQRMSWNGCKIACRLSASCYFNHNSETITQYSWYNGTDVKSHVDFLHPVISRR